MYFVEWVYTGVCSVKVRVEGSSFSIHQRPFLRSQFIPTLGEENVKKTCLISKTLQDVNIENLGSQNQNDSL